MRLPSRRNFVLSLAAAAASRRGFFFSTQRRMAMMNADGSGLRYLEFDRPGQASWQPGPFFPGKRRMVIVSFEPGPAFTGNVPSRLWIHDLDTGSLEEIVPRPRLAPYYVPVLLLPKQEQLLVSIILQGESRLFQMGLDGKGQREITRAGEGFSYGFSLSPDERRLAFHASGPRPHGYRIFTSDLDGSRRVLVAGDPDHLYFGTSWSPDGQWILFQDCHFRLDPGHDWSDLCIGRPDGSGHRVLTTGQSHWFGTSYGPPGNSGNGSNMPEWMPDGSAITYSRRLPGSKPAWEFQPQRPDTDHFNRDFKPEQARGGTQICLLDPTSGAVTPLTPAVDGQWDFRTAMSPDGRQVLFSRARTGAPPAIWIMDRDGRNQRLLTQGREDSGADFARWMP